MSFNVGESFEGGARKLCTITPIYSTLKNPIFTALLITVLALVIIFTFCLRDGKVKGWQSKARTGFWLMAAISAVLFVHYYALKKDLTARFKQSGVNDMMDEILTPRTQEGGRGGYAVHPGTAYNPMSDFDEWHTPENLRRDSREGGAEAKPPPADDLPMAVLPSAAE